MPDKLLVVSVDAMHIDDIPFARTLPAFGRILERASIAEIEGVYPSLTYPNHTTQITGCSPAKHGIYNNTEFDLEQLAKPIWFWDRRHCRVPTVFTAARGAGLSTAAVQWPVTGNEQDVDWLLPAISSPQVFKGLEDQYRSTTNAASFDRYIAPNLHLVHTDGRKGKYFDLVNEVSVQVLRNERPDVAFFHYVDLDAARHANGSYGQHVAKALTAIDTTLGRLLEALRETGDLERTNIVLVSDHGHVDVEQHTNLNAVFAERGFVRLAEDGSLVDFDVYCLSSGLSAQLFLAEGITNQRRAEVETLLAQLQADPELRIEKIWTAEEARSEYGLDGPFSWVVETEPGVHVRDVVAGAAIVRPGDPEFVPHRGAHGHAPRHGGQPVFIASGPGFVPGLDLGRRSMLDQAPTFAALLGVDLPHAEGVPMADVLAPAHQPT